MLGALYRRANRIVAVIRIHLRCGNWPLFYLQLTISVADVNDCPPVFVEPRRPKTFSTREDAGVGSFIAAVSAEDPDLNSQITYSLKPSVVSSEFIFVWCLVRWRCEGTIRTTSSHAAPDCRALGGYRSGLELTTYRLGSPTFYDNANLSGSCLSEFCHGIMPQ